MALRWAQLCLTINLAQVTFGDGSLAVVDAGSGAVAQDAPSALKWTHRSTPIGDDVQGVWGKYSDANDINAIALGQDIGTLMVGLAPSSPGL